MTLLNILNHKGARKVSVVYKAGESISVVAKGTNDILYEMPTTRVGELNILQN